MQAMNGILSTDKSAEAGEYADSFPFGIMLGKLKTSSNELNPYLVGFILCYHGKLCFNVA